MLKEHIAEKLAYCNSCSPLGYVSRIDRAGEHPFGDVNEVNLIIMNAHLSNKNVEEEVQRFFNGKYGDSVGAEIYSIMSETEELHKKIFYINGYYFHQQSFFPQVNHSKNHFYFEQMRKDCSIASDEWFIPKGWKQSEVEELISEKQDAKDTAQKLYDKLCLL